MRTIVFIIILISASAAQAKIYKCTDETGKTKFTDRPCAGQSEDQSVYFEAPEAPLVQIEAETPQSSSANSSKISALRAQYLIAGDKVKRLQRAMDDLKDRQDSELARLNQKKMRANNNLAGATWEQSISQEMAAVVAIYKQKIDIAYDELNSAITERDDLKVQIEDAGGVVY